MAEEAARVDKLPRPAKSVSAGSTDSESSNVSEEERLKRLFDSCDGDGDGFIDGKDLGLMCRRLGMEESAEEIMTQLGIHASGKMSFSHFLRCRAAVMSEVASPAYPAYTPSSPLTPLNPPNPLSPGCLGDGEGGYGEDTGVESDASGFLPPMTSAGLSWPTASSDSLGAHSGHCESGDSGARDLSPEPACLSALIEAHDPSALQTLASTLPQPTSQLLELANRLHLAALTSLKGEIIDLTNRLQHVSNERDLLEKQYNKAQAERMRMQQDFEDRLEEVTSRYEERVIELHSVIAELRKKIERHQINIIREEEEEYEESDTAQSNKSNDGGSLNENNGNDSQVASAADLGTEISADLEKAIGDRSALPLSLESRAYKPHKGRDDGSSQGDPQEEENRRSEQASRLELMCRELVQHDGDSSPPPPPRPLRPATFSAPPPPPSLRPPPPPPPEESPSRSMEVRHQDEVQQLQDLLASTRLERDAFQAKVQELQSQLSSGEGGTCHSDSRTPTPTKGPLPPTPSRAPASPSTDRSPGGQGSAMSLTDQFPVAKVAGLKKLKTFATDRQVTGPEISALGLATPSVAEHLVQSLQDCSSVQEMVNTAYLYGSQQTGKTREFELELERLSSRARHLQAQSDVLAATLAESKSQSERLVSLLGQSESNTTALSLALSYADTAIEALEVYGSLLESQMAILVAHCKAAGIAGFGLEDTEEQEDLAALLQRAHSGRRTAENVARHLLHKLDRSCGVQSHPHHHHHPPAPQPWEDVSSHTASTSSSTTSSLDADYGRGGGVGGEEHRLREYIQQLKSDRAAVRLTVLELEPVHIEPCVDLPRRLTDDAQRLDLENAVLVQELMAVKEERAELKAHNYLLEKEKRVLELRLSGKESQEAAYRVTIDHLKSQVQEHMPAEQGKEEDGRSREATPTLTLAELRGGPGGDGDDTERALADALRRERRLKSRLQELVATLERVSQNAEQRHQQSAELVADLKRANAALIAAFEKAKKKYQQRLKKLEAQAAATSERYEAQIRMLKQKLGGLEEPNGRPPPNETSL